MKTNTLSNAPRGPTHEEIAKVAYQFFEERGRRHGYDVVDWLRAVAHVCSDENHVAQLTTEAGPNPEHPSRPNWPVVPAQLS